MCGRPRHWVDMTRDELFSVPELKEKGWTPTAIKNFLPAHDDERENPIYKCASPMKFYSIARVKRVERSKKFAAWVVASAPRKASAATGVLTKIGNMEAFIKTAELTIIPGKTPGEIERLASETHGGNYAGDPGPFTFSCRTALNCIRHNLTNYEELWNTINRGYTGQRAYEILSKRINALVKKTYPVCCYCAGAECGLGQNKIAKQQSLQ